MCEDLYVWNLSYKYASKQRDRFWKIMKKCKQHVPSSTKFSPFKDQFLNHVVHIMLFRVCSFSGCKERLVVENSCEQLWLTVSSCEQLKIVHYKKFTKLWRKIVTDFISVTICDGICDGLIWFVTEWQVHVNWGILWRKIRNLWRKIRHKIKSCQTFVTGPSQKSAFVTDCDGPVTIQLTNFFFLVFEIGTLLASRHFDYRSYPLHLKRPQKPTTPITPSPPHFRCRCTPEAATPAGDCNCKNPATSGAKK